GGGLPVSSRVSLAKIRRSRAGGNPVSPHDRLPWAPPFAGATGRIWLRVNLRHLVMRPFYRVPRRHAPDRLGVHVDHAVLGDDLGSLAVGRPGIAGEPADLWQVAERQQDRVDVPNRILLPILGRPVGVTLLRGEPLRIDVL